MAKPKFQFEDFMGDVPMDHAEFVRDLHEFLTGQDCTIKIEQAKNGFCVSYAYAKTKKVLANFVFRKKGMFVRIYGGFIGQYSEVLTSMPEEMIKTIEKAPVCKRLMDPEKCSSTCPMGYIFSLGDTEHKKCRYNCFLFLLSEESKPSIRQILEREVGARSVA